MASSKWMHVPLDAAWPDAAREVLSTRLSRVVSQARRVRTSDAAPKEVHRLRVAVRRAHAALDVFESVAPRRRRRRIARLLKRVRRAAGEARDLDVLAARIRKRELAGEYPLIWKELRRQRSQARRRLYRAVRPRKLARLAARTERFVGRIRSRARGAEAESTFGEVARSQLLSIADSFFAASSRDLEDIESLHELRIAGKRLRYALEIFAGVLPRASIERLYRPLQALQNVLGEVNDHASAIERFSNWRRWSIDQALNAELDRIIAEERRGLDEARQKFREFWTSETVAALRDDFGQSLGDERATDGDACAESA